MPRLALFLVGCAVAASLVGAPLDGPRSASAAGPSTVSISGAAINFTAAPDTGNFVDVSVDTANERYEFLEGGGQNLIAGAGCTQAFDNIAHCPYAGVSAINVSVGAGASDQGNTVRILGLLGEDSASVTGGAAQDGLIVGAGDVGGFGAVVFAGSGGTNDYVELDHFSGPQQTWTITSGAVTSGTFAGLTYSGTEAITAYLGNGDQTVNINSTNADAAYTLLTGSGESTVTVGAGDLSSLPGRVGISASTGSHHLIVNDSATSGSEDYVLSAGGLARTGGFGGLTYFLGGGSANVTLNAQQGSNGIQVGGLGEPTTINANGGNDELFAGSHLEFALAHPMTFNGGGGTDTAELNDDAFTSDDGDAYTVTSTTVTSPGFATFTYGATEGLTLVGNYHGDSITVDSLGVPLVIDAASSFQTLGDVDSITVGNGDLDSITSNVRVEGGADPDSLFVVDDLHAAPEEYIYTRDTIDRANFGHLTYVGMTFVSLATGPGNDTIRIGTTEEGVDNVLSSDGGNDAYLVTAGGIGLATTGSTSIDGGVHLAGDSLTVYDGGLSVSDNGGTISTAGRQPIHYVNIENTDILPSTDTDGDGCSDVQEGADDPVNGGDRDPLNPWDFYDVTANKSIDLNDTLAILSKFGLGPLDEGYVASYDRVPGPPAKRHRTAQATGAAVGITLEDALANLASFGHSCA